MDREMLRDSGCRYRLFGVLFPQYTVVKFNPSGNYVDTLRQPMTEGAFEVVYGIYRGNPEVIGTGLEALKENIGFVAGTIHVARFWLEDAGIRIEVLPEHLLESVDDEQFFHDFLSPFGFKKLDAFFRMSFSNVARPKSRSRSAMQVVSALLYSRVSKAAAAFWRKASFH